MTKKSKKENTTRTVTKKVPFWLDPKAPLAFDCELVEAVNKIIWKNILLSQREIAGKLEMAGIFARHKFMDMLPMNVGELLELISYDIDAAKNCIFRPPELSNKALRDPRIREAFRAEVRDCKMALKSRLIFFGLLSEDDGENGGCDSQYLTFYAIFRKPKTNKCFVAILSDAQEPSKNLASSDVPSTTSSPTSPSSSALAGKSRKN